jgi:hypothetical protein
MPEQRMVKQEKQKRLRSIVSSGIALLGFVFGFIVAFTFDPLLYAFAFATIVTGLCYAKSWRVGLIASALWVVLFAFALGQLATYFGSMTALRF